MSLNLKSRTKNLADNYRTEPKSELSDLSLSTENKVFGGALSLLNKQQPSKFQKADSEEIDEKNVTGTSQGSPSKLRFDEKKVNINDIIDSTNALEPLSFRPSNKHLVEGLEKQILENISHQEDSTNYTIQNTLTSSKHSTKKIESSNDNSLGGNIKYIEEGKVPQTYNNYVKEEEEKEIYSEVEEKVLANFEGEENEIEESNENVFWNLQNKVNQPGVSGMKRSKSDMDNVGTAATPNQAPKSYNSSQILCTFAKIDKGNAIFVSADDIIFSLPMNFLPKNAIPGNTYRITIEETEKVHKKITYLQNMQKRFLFLNFDDNHK